MWGWAAVSMVVLVFLWMRLLVFLVVREGVRVGTCMGVVVSRYTWAPFWTGGGAVRQEEVVSSLVLLVPSVALPKPWRGTVFRAIDARVGLAPWCVVLLLRPPICGVPVTMMWLARVGMAVGHSRLRGG